MENITKENYSVLFGHFAKEMQLDLRKAAVALGCSQPTLERLLSGKSVPSDEMLRQTAVLMAIGLTKYQKLSAAEKGTISEKLGAATLGGFGIVATGTVVSSLGIAGLSGAGIMSGLAALGALAGGGAALGISVAAALPIAAGTIGYFGIKGIKKGLKL